MTGGRGLRRMERAVVLAGVVVAAVVGEVAAHGSSAFSRNVPSAGITRDIALRLGLSHLSLEEALADQAYHAVFKPLLAMADAHIDTVDRQVRRDQTALDRVGAATAQVAHLEALGCTRGQGYHFARPMPAAWLSEIVATARTLPQGV